MTLNKDELKDFYFRFLNNETSLEDFEQWIYATPEIENDLGETAYLELASFNFRQQRAKYEFIKLMYQHIIPPEFYTWQFRQILQNLLDDSLDSVDLFKTLYNLYDDDGYYFLHDIGILYVLYTPYLELDRHDATEYQNLRKTLEQYLPVVKKEIEILLAALDSGKLKMISLDKFGIRYEIASDLQEELNAIGDQVMQIKKQHTQISSPVPKKWWKFWK